MTDALNAAVQKFAWWIVTGGVVVVISMTAVAATWAERKEQQIYALQVQNTNLEDDVGQLTEAVQNLAVAVERLDATLRERAR